MPTPPQKKTVAMVLGTVLVAAIPSLVGYLQNRDEIKAKYRQTEAAASSGYDALASSVKELQKETIAQHDYIVKMQAQLEMMQAFVVARTERSTGTMAVAEPRPGHPRPPAVVEVQPPKLPKPPIAPAYGKMPDSFNAAQRPDKD